MEQLPKEPYGGVWAYVEPQGPRRVISSMVRAWIAALGLWMSGASFGAWCMAPEDKLPLALSVTLLVMFFWGIIEESKG